MQIITQHDQHHSLSLYGTYFYRTYNNVPHKEMIYEREYY